MTDDFEHDPAATPERTADVAAGDDMDGYAEPCTVNGTDVMLDGAYHLADDVLAAAGYDAERHHLYEDPAALERGAVADPLVDVCFASGDCRAFLAVPVDEPAPTATATTALGAVEDASEAAHPRGEAYSARRRQDTDGDSTGDAS